MTRRNLLRSSMLAGPAALLADTPPADRPTPAAKPIKITKVEVLHLEKPLKERFWMANSPIGGYKPKASQKFAVVQPSDSPVSRDSAITRIPPAGSQRKILE